MHYMQRDPVADASHCHVGISPDTRNADCSLFRRNPSAKFPCTATAGSLSALSTYEGWKVSFSLASGMRTTKRRPNRSAKDLLSCVSCTKIKNSENLSRNVFKRRGGRSATPRRIDHSSAALLSDHYRVVSNEALWPPSSFAG